MARYKVHYNVYYVNNDMYPNKSQTVTASSPEEAQQLVEEDERARADGVPIRGLSFDKVAEIVDKPRGTNVKRAGGRP
jgi:hypothetical protein